MIQPLILRGDARNLPLPDSSVDLVVTSPPYFGLRSYQDGGQHYGGQLGAEHTPTDYVDALIACTREMVRVLKPEGSIFINLGDKYAGSGGHSPDAPSNVSRRAGATGQFRGAATMHTRQAGAGTRGKRWGLPAKSLAGIPWRYALRAIDDLGLTLRAELIWSKPNALPESVKDRVRRSHEQWFHFTLQPQYYSAVDEIREPHKRTWTPGRSGGHTYEAMKARGEKDSNLAASSPNALGALPGSVWQIATQPLKVPAELGVDHFAAFPMEWPRRLILGWSPREVCTECGEGRRPTTRVAKTHAPRPSRVTALTQAHGHDGREGARPSSLVNITGYACRCPDTSAPATPGVVLDPFGGTGTTALVASVLGRVGISVDASADYCRLARWRTADPKQRARAAGKPGGSPPRRRPEPPSQFALEF